MKTSGLILVTICVTLFPQSDAAAQQSASQWSPRSSSADKETKDSGSVKHTTPARGGKPQQMYPAQERNRHSSNANHTNYHANVAGATPPKQFPNSQPRAMGNPGDLSQISPIKPVTNTKPRSIQDRRVNKALAVRPPALLPASSPALGTVRHRGANPPVVGGGNSLVSNTTTINGTRMTRRP
jgi:hypothetical protein